MLEPRRDLRRAAWLYQMLELRQVDAARILDRRDEILAGRRLAVVPLEIEVGAGAELLGPSTVWIIRISSAPLL